jgi:uncharacterized protein
MYLKKFYPFPTRASTKSASDFARKSGEVFGVAMKFGELDAHKDRTLPGAFSGVAPSGVKMFFNHDSSAVPIGRWLEFSEIGDEFIALGELTKGVALADDIDAAIAHGTLDGLSVAGFVEAEKNAEGGLNIAAWALVEISVVSFPAVLSARIGTGAKSLDDAAALSRIAAALQNLHKQLTN